MSRGGRTAFLKEAHAGRRLQIGGERLSSVRHRRGGVSPKKDPADQKKKARAMRGDNAERKSRRKHILLPRREDDEDLPWIDEGLSKNVCVKNHSFYHGKKTPRRREHAESTILAQKRTLLSARGRSRRSSSPQPRARKEKSSSSFISS